ncbi:hypothetical protein [Papillibacter cinnamivorans]|uniref:Uncharacterized protein n=1 Tax=Papillibacter cinnamivorans DSM 12816 TaxID=1122930 RepID=A0A1W1YYT5_9FIRM|nr:hypothetical protein [Papillibacter cinnamivorans]SMC40971.1 hypothetical protein SAMN02745168_0761 [Papillibacter cinnamivorans DSM 12816]
MWEVFIKPAIPIVLSLVIGGLATYLISTCGHGRRIKNLESDMKGVAGEQRMILKSVRAALYGLQEQGCNGPVTQGINELEQWLNDTAHTLKSGN